MIKQPIRFGIVGCGMIANVHAQAIRSIPEAMLLGVTGVEQKQTQQFAESYCIHAYETYEQMLKSAEIDAVCICTPSCFHAEQAMMALRAEKHVVLEKPMAFDTKSADALVAACAQSGKLLTVISQLRFSKDVLMAKKLLEEHALGKLSLCSLYMKYYRAPAYFSSSDWKGKKKFEGGGALMNQGIHGVDVLEYVVGPIKSVQGKAATRQHAIEVEDTAVAMLEFECGALGVIEASTCAYPGFDRRIEIFGERGCLILREGKIERLVIDGEDVEVCPMHDVATSSDPSGVKMEMHALQIKNMIAAIYGEEDLVMDAAEGRKAIRVIEKIYQA